MSKSSIFSKEFDWGKTSKRRYKLYNGSTEVVGVITLERNGEYTAEAELCGQCGDNSWEVLGSFPTLAKAKSRVKSFICSQIEE